MRIHKTENSISPVVGIAILVAVAVVMSALVFAVTSGFMTEQQAPSAGANVTIVSESVIEVQLDSVQNADNVYVQSPLGTRYEFEGVGDTVEILNIGNEQKPVVIAEKDGKESVVQGITPRSFDADYVIEQNDEISTVLSKASPGDVVAVKKGVYEDSPTIGESIHVVSEHGTVFNGDVSVSSGATFSNAEVKETINVKGDDAYLAATKGSINTTSDVKYVKSTNKLLKSDTHQSGDSINKKPEPKFIYTPENPTIGDVVSFDASDSNDPDGSISSYEWDLNGDSTVDETGKSLNYSFNTKGDYNITLTVTDDSGSSVDIQKTIRVVNSAPNADFVYSPSDIKTGETVSFDASGSSDPDNDSLTYSWDFDGDGEIERSGVNPTYTYSNAGTYEVSLKVNDGDNRSDTTVKTLTVDTNTVIIDDFEDGDLSEYNKVDTSGSNSIYVDDSPPSGVPSGSHALKFVASTGTPQMQSVGRNLDYPEQGDTITYYHYRGSSASSQAPMFFFGVQSETDFPNNYYSVRTSTRSDELRLRLRENGTSTFLDTETANWPSNEWIKTEIDWSDSGKITVVSWDEQGNEIASVSATDNTHTSGGMGFSLGINSGSTHRAWFDYTIKE